MKVISLINYKGGTGKSTIASNIAYRLAQKGYSVLGIDLDPQAHLTTLLGIKTIDIPKLQTLYDIIVNNHPPQNVILKPKPELTNLYLIPGNLKLTALEEHLIVTTFRELQLKNFLENSLKSALQPSENIDFVIIDCPPFSSILNTNALIASNILIIPMTTDYLSYDGLILLFSSMERISKTIKFPLEKVYIIINQLNKNYSISELMLSAIKRSYYEYMTNIEIRQDVSIRWAQAKQKTIFEYKPNSKFAKDIDLLVKLILKDFSDVKKQKQQKTETNSKAKAKSEQTGKESQN